MITWLLRFISNFLKAQWDLLKAGYRFDEELSGHAPKGRYKGGELDKEINNPRLKPHLGVTKKLS